MILAHHKLQINFAITNTVLCIIFFIVLIKETELLISLDKEIDPKLIFITKIFVSTSPVLTVLIQVL